MQSQSNTKIINKVFISYLIIYMPYEFTYDWSAPVENNYDETFHNSTRKSLTTHGFTFYMDEYDLDKSVH